MQGDGRRQILQLLREAQGQPRKPLHERADCQVVPLDVRRAYRLEVVYSAYVPAVGVFQLRRGVAAHFGIRIVLYQHAMPCRADPPNALSISVG